MVEGGDAKVGVFGGAALAAYGFGRDHPFNARRHDTFFEAFALAGLEQRTRRYLPRSATRAELELFHTARYLDFVAARCAEGVGYLDGGDTPAQRGLDAAAAVVVGTTLEACRRVLVGEVARSFCPVGGLHHGARDGAAGFCVYDDCGVAIEWLRRQGLRRIAYVDIDAHHGDGVYYAFEDDPDLLFADIHQDGRTLYPGTGHADETGRGRARGTKLNLPLAPGARDAEFMAAWDEVERYLEATPPEFVLLQCGADSIAGDPLAQLRLTPASHAHAARRLATIASRPGCRGLVAVGGGGYDRDNLAAAWVGVVRSLLEA
jgi:acetoin utilization protein AcuC